VLADLPGLVPGAHEGKGRGIDFLKHLLKARCIALVVDMTGKSAGSKGATSSSSGNDSRAEEQGFALEGSPGQGDSWEALVPHTPKQQLRILLVSVGCCQHLADGLSAVILLKPCQRDSAKPCPASDLYLAARYTDSHVQHATTQPRHAAWSCSLPSPPTSLAC
jgi:hypothetical protein